MRAYEPVSCELVDVIEIFATRGEITTILFLENEIEIELSTKFKTWKTRKSVEFLVLENDKEIRLDKILQINGASDWSKSCKLL